MMSVKTFRLFPILGMVALGLMVAVWFFVSGCGKDPVVSNPSGPPKVAELQFKQWQKPAAVLILTGEQHGYIEPCGCSETQSGGLARRADLAGQLTELGWPLAGLDIGGSLRLTKSEAGADSRGSELLNKLQSQLKFQTQLKAMESMRYSALALGFEELKLGAGGLLNDFGAKLTPQGQEDYPVFLGANVLLFGEEFLGPSRTQILSVGEVKIGVTAIVGESIRRKLYGDNPAGEELEIKPPAEVLPGVIQNLKSEQTDFNILLSHASLEETQSLVKQFPDFEIAVCQGGEEGRKEPQAAGRTQILQVGWKGKHVGVLGYFPEDAEQKFRFELVELDNQRFENDPSIEPFLIEYQNQLEAREEELYSSENMASGFHSKPGEFVGAETCGACHTRAYDKWKSSKHAHAYETLKTGRKGQYSQPIGRTHDPECLSCHVTGWDPQGVFPYDSGFLPEKVAEAKSQPDRYHKLQGQQCENCHGPGSEHVQLEVAFKRDPKSTDREKLIAGRRQMVLTKATAEDHLCKNCHDFENSPKFDFDKYWEQIKHPWRD
jgi:hypothetical protein